MDVGLYREDEQFMFTSSAYMECYSSNSASYTLEQNEFFERIRPMPQPPNEIFEWHGEDNKKTLNNGIEMIDELQIDHQDTYVSVPIKQELNSNLVSQNWQTLYKPLCNNTLVEQLPIAVNYISEEHLQIRSNKTAPPTLQEILDLPEIVNNLKPSHASLANIKIEKDCDPHMPTSISEYSENRINSSGSYRRESESLDLLNTSFSSTELTNFDIAEYVFEEDKQTKKSINVSEEIKIELVTITDPQQPSIVQTVNIKQEPDFEKNVNIKQEPEFKEKSSIKPILNVNVSSKRAIKAGVKKIDLKAQKYIIENDAKMTGRKKSFSEEDYDVDIETVSEEESSPILEAGNITDLLEQFEATEEKNKEHIISNNKCNVDVKADVKIEKGETKMTFIPKAVKIEPKVEKKIDIKKPVEIKNETSLKRDLKSVKNEPEQQSKLNKPKPKTSEEKLYINNKIPSVSMVKSKITFSKTPGASSNTSPNTDSLPQELINRIKETGKRKTITVIEPIPNNRKRMKIQESFKPQPCTTSSETVHLDHNYCSSNSSLNKQTIKKDSGFASSEEDDKNILGRQLTVKNADGTLMVSLLKANTIRQMNPSNEALKNQKKKLNLEEYKKRKNGIITPKTQSQNCSPSASICGSPPEDDHQKMVKHQEKLKKMAEELLKAAPKSEKKPEITGSLLKVPILLSPVPLAQVSHLGSPTITKEIAIKTENVKVEATNNNNRAKESVVKNIKVKIEAPEVPPNLERKVFVSFGVNTDFRIAKNEDPLAPVEKLQEIKPLLEKVSNKINENSLIASVIENIPKVLNKNEKLEEKKSLKQEKVEHGEFKKIIYLEKNRVRPETKDKGTQTNISLIEQSKHGRIRRRISSSSSCSSYKSKRPDLSRRSRKRSDSSCSSRSHSRSSSTRSSDYSSRSSSRLSYSRSRSRSPLYNRRRHNKSVEREHLNAVEERRIIYVGKIETGTSKNDLRRKFQKFGPINNISLHFRDIGENYGFVTFKYKEDAHEAYEHGNDDSAYPTYKISFGGRREFCKSAYSDLDNVKDNDGYYQSQSAGAGSYDQLLKEALEKLKKRKA